MALLYVLGAPPEIRTRNRPIICGRLSARLIGPMLYP